MSIRFFPKFVIIIKPPNRLYKKQLMLNFTAISKIFLALEKKTKITGIALEKVKYYSFHYVISQKYIYF